jgi:hypothetical protein
MNDEYISKKQVVDLLSSLPNPYDLLPLHTIAMAIYFIEKEPAADVLPIKYGEWIFQGQYDKEGRRIYHCSKCNFEVGVFPYNFIAWRTHEKYCCGCGARMDGVRNERAKMHSEAY